MSSTALQLRHIADAPGAALDVISPLSPRRLGTWPPCCSGLHRPWQPCERHQQGRASEVHTNLGYTLVHSDGAWYQLSMLLDGRGLPNCNATSSCRPDPGHPFCAAHFSPFAAVLCYPVPFLQAGGAYRKAPGRALQVREDKLTASRRRHQRK